MRIAHFSDTHLGFTRFTRPAPSGINQREYDVLMSFGRVLDAMAGEDPDIVVHAGDFFDAVRPSNWSLTWAFSRVLKFQQARSGRPFFIVGGNHDTPNTRGAGHALQLFKNIPGVEIGVNGIESVLNEELDLEVKLVANRGLRDEDRVSMAPETQASTRVIVVHGLATGLVKDAPGEFDPEEVRADRWTYVALGDFHIRSGFGVDAGYPANMGYSGSTDLTTTNIWEELSVPKTWTLYDTGTGKATHHPIPPSRTAIDLPWIDAAGLTVSQLEEALLAARTWDAEQLPMVRQIVKNVNSEVKKALNRQILTDLEKTCLSYQFIPQVIREQTFERGEVGADGVPKVLALEEEWATHVAQLQLPMGLEREEVVKTGQSLLLEVADAADSTEA